jgi:hypothetical protein
MSRRGAISILIGCIIGLGLVWIIQSNRRAAQPEQPTPGGETSIETQAEVPDSAQSTTSEVMPRSPLADDLNAPDYTAEHDVRILRDILTHWRTNLKNIGNPIGTNAEITRALTGRNPLNLAFIPPDHPAINKNGELCDRWGTPFRFHQLSGTVMEITSAGPDRDFATDDDITAR